jgi:hypothetical protein
MWVLFWLGGIVVAVNTWEAVSRSCASLRPRHTGHPDHRRSCASLRPRHTGHPDHKPKKSEGSIYRVKKYLNQAR